MEPDTSTSFAQFIFKAVTGVLDMEGYLLYLCFCSIQGAGKIRNTDPKPQFYRVFSSVSLTSRLEPFWKWLALIHTPGLVTATRSSNDHRGHFGIEPTAVAYLCSLKFEAIVCFLKEL